LTRAVAARDVGAMKVALIAGAGGAASKRLIEVLLADPDWSVIGLARTPRHSAERLGWIAADLSDRDSCRRALAGQTAVSHIFYTARAKHGETGVESVPDNVAMLRNLIDAIEPVASGLAHVHLVEGTKYYGMHLGPFRTPAREDDPRPDFPNFYYDQQDLLAERTRGKVWAWSASRPTFIYDFAPERARNAVAVIGAYAALCRELRLPLDFPGSAAAFDAQRDLTDASLLASAMKFMSVTPACRNEAFNVNNGDVVTWRALWSRIANFFAIAAGEVRPFSLHDWSRDKQPVWDSIVRRYGLAPTSLDNVADWAFADFHWAQSYDVVSSPEKLQGAGFAETIDSGQMLLAHLQRYRDAKILP
jgi:nucleoside-diphosphate-sugar epimerase